MIQFDKINVMFFTFQAAEIERRIEQETKAEKHIQKLLLLGINININIINK